MPLYPVRRLGNVLTGMSYADWLAYVKATGGASVALPSNVPPSMQAYVGQPAARYDAATYASLWNAGTLDANAPQVSSNNNAYVYVVAPTSAWADAPHTMTTSEQMENAIFSGADAAASSVGLPSLASIGQFLLGAGREILIGIAVSAGVVYLGKRLMRKR